MNENFISVIYPPFPSKATHVVVERTFFYDASDENIPPIGKNPIIDIKNVLEIGQEITLIEYGLGYKNEWSKVITENGDYIYVLTKDIEIKQELINSYPGVKNINGPLYPVNNLVEYLPDYSLQKINWREQQPNIVFEDRYLAKLCVHYERADVTEIKNDDDLKQKIKEACYAGTKIILQSKGYVISDKLLYDLVDNFYFFSKAEEYYFPIRNCSTLRVLVTLPTRFLYAANILLSDDAVLDPEEFGRTGFLNENGLGDLNPNSPASTPDDDSSSSINDVILAYNNKEELDVHFSTIAANLVSVFSMFTVPPSKTWIIEPATTPNIIPGLGAVNLLEQQQKIGDLHKQINEFIYNNFVEQSRFHNDGLQNYKRIFNKKEVDKNDINNWFSITDILTLKSTKSANYEGKIQLIIDKVNLVLKDIKFFTLEDVEIPLNVGKEKFLNLDVVKNKTSLNYLCKIPVYSALSTEYNSWNKENTTVSLKINNSDKLVKKIVDELFSIKSNLDESELRNFLISNHYPTITSVNSRPLPITFSCGDVKNAGVTLEQRLAALRIAESPREKLRAYNQLLFDAQNSLSLEGNNFSRYVNAPKTIQNPNFKILLGIVDLSPDQEMAINQFIAAASTIDWPRYLQDSVRCAGIKFDPRTFTDILNDFDRARQLLDSCNPFSNNLLNQLSNFSLPELPDYNPNASLVQDLRNLIIKIITESLMFVIRKLIEDALKACLNAIAEKNAPVASSEDLYPNPPLKQGLNDLKNIDEANALMKDIFGVNAGGNIALMPNMPDIGQSPKNSNNDLENAKALLGNLLDDIIPCLSVREMCDLLSGRSLNNDVYDFVFSLIKKKYNFNTGNVNLALKLNSKEEISNFFKKIGAAFNLNICSDFLDNLENTGRVPTNPLCDDGTRKARQKEILENKGLSPEQIDNLINDLQNTDEQNLRDILNFLNSPNTPFDLNNIPTVLCKKGPNGEIIPPAVSLAPPMKMFGKVLDSVFKPVYDNFDTEAQEWYKNTYSTISSANKNHLSFKNGKLEINVDKSKTPSEEEKRQTPKDKLKINYLFDISAKNIKLQNGIYNFAVDGFKEQELETNIASAEIRQKVIRDNISLYNFLDKIFLFYEQKLNFDANNALKNSVTKPPVQQFLSLGVAFYASSLAVINDSARVERLKKLFNFSENDVANSLFAEDISLPIRDTLVQLLDNNDVKSFLNTIEVPVNNYKKETFNIKEYQLGNSALNLYSNFDVSFKLEDRIVNNNLFNDYNINIKRNGINYINISQTRQLDSSLINYLTSFGAGDVNNLSKQNIFDKFIENKKQQFGTNYFSESLKRVKEKINITSTNDSFLSNNIGAANYKAFCESILKEVSNNISNSPFSKTINFSIQTDAAAGEFKDPGEAFLKPPDLTNPSQRESNTPMTQYMTLVIPQTPTQKACNIRPHYLDIDNIKEDIFKAKEEAFCLEEIKNEKIMQGKDVDTQELADEEPTDTQNVMLDGGYRLMLRVYLHDLLLRAISLFGIYDPQFLRKDDIFHTFMTEMIEAEMRSKDNTVFNMMNAYYSRQNLTIKDIAVQELKTNVLPKMAKRINEDTNEKLASLIPPQNVILKPAEDYYDKNSKLIKIDPATKSVYIRVSGTKILQTTLNNQKSILSLQTYNQQTLDPLKKYEELIFYQKIFSSTTKATSNQQIINDIVEEFKNSNEYKLLFEFLIPKKEILTFLFISNVLANTSNKKRRNSFEMTKNGIQNSIKYMATSGAPIKPNPNNYQDMKNSDSSISFLKFILMAAISAPISIVKGYTELTEPNIALSANIYRLAKSMAPETPSAIIPAISLPLGIPIPPVLPFGIIPWFNIPLCLFYLLTGIWADSSSNNQTEKDKKTSKDLLTKLSKGMAIQAAPDCSTIFNPDVIKLSIAGDGEAYYDVKKPSSEFISADLTAVEEINEKSIIKDYQIRQILKKGEFYKDPIFKDYFVQLPNNKGLDQAKVGLLKSILNSVDADLISDIFESPADKQEENLKNLIFAKVGPKNKVEDKKKTTQKIKETLKDKKILNDKKVNEVVKNMDKQILNDMVKEITKEKPSAILKEVIKDLPKQVIKELPREVVKQVIKQGTKDIPSDIKKTLKDDKTIKDKLPGKKPSKTR